MNLNIYFSEILSQDVITAKDLHQVLKFNGNQYNSFVKSWLGEIYCFPDKQIRTPKEGKDYSILIPSIEVDSSQNYELSIPLARLITLNSRSLVKLKYAQWLLEIEQQKESLQLLTHKQAAFIYNLLNKFKFIQNQKDVMEEHSDKYVHERRNSSKTKRHLYATFHTWRNSVLDISKEDVECRLKEYCVENEKSVNIFKKPKFEQIFVMDNYETLKHAVWDFMKINEKDKMALRISEVAYNLANECKLEIFRKNETNLFQTKVEQLVLSF